MPSYDLIVEKVFCASISKFLSSHGETKFHLCRKSSAFPCITRLKPMCFQELQNKMPSYDLIVEKVFCASISKFLSSHGETKFHLCRKSSAFPCITRLKPMCFQELRNKIYLLCFIANEGQMSPFFCFFK